MSRIQALDEITARLGHPALLRWVEAPHGATAAVLRLRHRGAVVDLSASGTFRVIFQLSPSQVLRGESSAADSRDTVRAGSVITSFTRQPERIRIFGAADTLHLLFSPELLSACGARSMQPSQLNLRELQAIAARTLVACSLGGSETQLQEAVASVARIVVASPSQPPASAGGLAPHARRAVHDLLDQRLRGGVTVPELAQAASLSLHHFIRVCRQSEGLTPHALLTQKRIERSLELLLQRRVSVDEVAATVGFSSPSHFISSFRRLVGVTPASLRRAAVG